MLKSITTCYYGEQTSLALANFPLSYPRVHIELIHAIALIKRASVQAHVATDEIPNDIGLAIEKAAQEVESGVFDDQFLLPGIQGGAGTSIHMNVNEVIAARAEELLQQQGKKHAVHPNDHVNMSQSTNDVNPSALRIVLIRLMQQFDKELKELVQEMETLIATYGSVRKLARTHMQDAVPTTIQEEWSAYCAIVTRNRERGESVCKQLYELNLGGSAIGNGVNVSSSYKKKIYVVLEEISGLPIRPAKNQMALTSSATDFSMVAHYLTAVMADISKMATDIRFLSSGPFGGIGELIVAELQSGSSIMPGKRNPVIPELMNQVYFRLTGNAVTVQMAAEQSHLQLAVMFPVIADVLITSVKLSIDALRLFRTKGVALLQVDTKRCEKLLSESFVFATLFTPVLGYDVVAALVKEGLKKKVPFTRLLIDKKLLTQNEIDTILKA